MRFRVGDIVARSQGYVFPCTNKTHGTVLGFSDDTWDAWLHIEGEYYDHPADGECINHYNPDFIVLVERPVIRRYVKKLELIKL